MDSYLDRLKKEPVKSKENGTRHSWRPVSPHERSTSFTVCFFQVISLALNLGAIAVMVDSALSGFKQLPFLTFVLLACGLFFMKVAESEEK